VVAAEIVFGNLSAGGDVNEPANPLLHRGQIFVSHASSFEHDSAERGRYVRTLELSCSRSNAIRGLPIPLRGICETKLIRPGILYGASRDRQASATLALVRSRFAATTTRWTRVSRFRSSSGNATASCTPSIDDTTATISVGSILRPATLM